MKKFFLSKLIAVVLITTIIISLDFNVMAVSENDKQKLQEQINQTKSELEGISNDKKTASSELDKINEQVQDTQNEIANLKAEISQINNQIEDKKVEIAKEEKEIKAKNELLKERMVAMYEAGETSYLDVLLNSEDLIDFISGYSAIQSIVEADTNLINELEDKKNKLEEDKTSLEKDKEKVEELKKTQEIKNGTLISLQKSKEAEIAKLTDEQKEKQSELESYNSAMQRVNEELAAMAKKAEEALRRQREAEEATNRKSGSSGQSYSGLSGLNFDGSFIWPCNNKIVTSTLKRRWGRWHKGIDIGASYESVYASASGYAYNAYDSNGYGKYIMIFHGSGYVSLYGHLSSSHVSDGTYVKQGQTIATSGNTGGSTGPHLHFELRRATSISQFFSNSPLNPLDYLPGGYSLAPGATTSS